MWPQNNIEQIEIYLPLKRLAPPRGDQQPEQEPELDPEFSYHGRNLSRSRSGKFFKKPDQEPEPELCYGSFSFKLSFAYVRKIEQNSI